MRDICSIVRITKQRVDGVDVDVETEIYGGKCKVQAATTLAATAQEVGGALVTQTTRRVDIPMSAPEVKVNDVWKGVDCLDAQLNGKRLRITSRFGKTYATARRLEVKEP